MYVVAMMRGGQKLWLTASGRWTPDVHGAIKLEFGKDTFQTPQRVWIEAAPA